MNITVNSLFDRISKKTTLQFSVFIISLSIVFSLVIYLREADIKDQIHFSNVLLWQVIIWIPWIVVFYLSPRIRTSLRPVKYGETIYYGSGFICLCIHYGWFFWISSNYSPYLGMPATGFGVYPYFFIFWTLVDLIIIGIIYTIGRNNSVKIISKPIMIELNRGGETFFCNPKDIYWLASDNYYTHLHTIHGKFVMRKTLKHYKEQINSQDFVQIHRSTVINVQYVKGFTRYNKRLFVILKDDSKKPVSKKNVPGVKAIFRTQML